MPKLWQDFIFTESTLLRKWNIQIQIFLYLNEVITNIFWPNPEGKATLGNAFVSILWLSVHGQSQNFVNFSESRVLKDTVLFLNDNFHLLFLKKEAVLLTHFSLLISKNYSYVVQIMQLPKQKYASATNWNKAVMYL